ncbi:MAG: hypothetical protein IPG32_12520 [Saprospirales bacterium]|nr:hypothetical protein [Saprospirales bacterium]
MYKASKLAAKKKRWDPAAEPEGPAAKQDSALMPPAPGVQASAPVQRTEEGADAQREAKLSSAITWASTAKIGKLSIRQLQKTLGVAETDVYDTETAGAVLDKQVSWGLKDADGRAGKTTFSRLGLVFTKEYTASTYNQEFWGQFLDEQGGVRPAFSGGISVAVYPHYKDQSNNNKEFLRQADPWAKRHQAVGVDESGGLKMNIPIPIKSTGEVIEKVNSITEGISNMLIENFFLKMGGQFEGSAGKIKNLGIFAHGMPYGLALEENDDYALLSQDRGTNRQSNVESFVQGLSGSLASGVNVQLFSCNTGREYNAKKPLEKEKYEHWQVSAKGGENSFGALLAEQLGQDATVYSHLTAGHTTRNFAAVVFGNEAGDSNGTHIFNLLYPDEFMTAEVDRLFPTLDTPSKEKAKALILKQMARHFKNTTSKEVSEVDPDFKGTSTNMGAEMFTDLARSKTLFQEHWKNKWLAAADNMKALKAAMKKAGLV